MHRLKWKETKNIMVIPPGSFNTGFRTSLTSDCGMSLVQSSMLPLKHLFCSFSSSRGNSVWEAIETGSTFQHLELTFVRMGNWNIWLFILSIVFWFLSYWTWEETHMSSHFTSIILIWILCLKLWYSCSTLSRQTNYLLMELFWNNGAAIGSFLFISYAVIFGCFPSAIVTQAP